MNFSVPHVGRMNAAREPRTRNSQLVIDEGVTYDYDNVGATMVAQAVA